MATSIETDPESTKKTFSKLFFIKATIFLDKVIENKGKLTNRFPNLDKLSRKKITEKLSNLLAKL